MAVHEVRFYPAGKRLTRLIAVLLLLLSTLLPVYAQQEDNSETDEIKPEDQLALQVFLLFQNGKYAEAIPLTEQLLEMYETSVGENDSLYGDTVTLLGTLHLKQGQYAEAEALYKRSSAIMEKALGSDDPLVASALNGPSGRRATLGTSGTPDGTNRPRRVVRAA